LARGIGRMSSLVRSMLVFGLVSGAEPITLISLLVVMTGACPRRNGWMFLLGIFTVETGIVLTATFLLGGSVSPSSKPGHSFLWARLIVGLALIIVGLLLRRPPGEQAAAKPDATQRLRGLTPTKSFVAGLVVADYVGPVLASVAIAATTVPLGGQLVAVACYSLVATGIPLTVMLVTTRSETALQKLTNGIVWVMDHRRVLGSWFALVAGTLVSADAIISIVQA